MPTSEQEWKRKLTAAQYHILREKGTEPPGSGTYTHHHGCGMYHCAGCGQALFSSAAKFDSGSGWPSFTETAGKVRLAQDDSSGMRRTEVLCRTCGGHLGHVFDDGPRPTGKRYCINSGALTFHRSLSGAED